MLGTINEAPNSIELASSGISGVTWNPVHEIALEADDSSQSDVQNLRIKFGSTFDQNSLFNGLYNLRFWLESSLQQANVNWVYALKDQNTLAATDFDGSALPDTDNIPVIYNELELVDKGTYFDNTEKAIGAIQVQLVAAPGVADYDTELEHRDDPRLVFEWDREPEGYLQFNEPNANSLQLFNFSQADIYLNEQNSPENGSIITRRHLIGWCADADFNFDGSKDTVDFKKGKPSATAITFFSNIKAMLQGKISSMDPWFFAKATAIDPTVENNKIVFTEKAQQRNIPIVNLTFEWQTNGGHLMQLNFPRAQLYLDGTLAPGANEIPAQGFKVMPLYDSCNKNVWQLKMSKPSMQRSALCVRYKTNAA